jgi:hypothetical protein
MCYTNRYGRTMTAQNDTDDEIESLEDLGGRDSDRVVRYYSADGTLYAYRDGDEHVVVSKGSEPADRWIDRVPRMRDAVLPGEELWTIPDNWRLQYRDRQGEHRTDHVYYIPESDCYVRLSVPEKTHLTDAWYSVVEVGGEIEAELAETGVDRAALQDLAATLPDVDAVPEDVVDVIQRLADTPERLERAYADAMSDAVDELLHEDILGGMGALDGGVAHNPWRPTLNTDHIAKAADRNRADGDTYTAVDRELSEAGVLSPDPDVRVDIDEWKTLTADYALRAAAEAGLSGGEAYDYLMAEVVGMTQTHWAEKRGIGQGSVSKNVSKAKRKLQN